VMNSIEQLNCSKKILVTGATSGIGYGVCEALLSTGIKVLAFGRNKQPIEHLEGRFGELIHFVSADLSVTKNIEPHIKSFHERYGKLDGMVHCAGLEETVPLSLLSNNRVKEMFDINVFSGIELLRICSKKTISNDQASFIFISSVMGALGQAGKIGYCASKAAVLGMVKSAALELSKRKIRVNAILPGIVKTPMTEKLFAGLSEINVKQIIEMHPLGIGEIGDIVPLVMFLLSMEAKWITGQSLVVDGGYSIQ